MAFVGRSAGEGAGSASAEDGDVPKCHLHRKQNKTCKFCKAFYSFQESKQKQAEERKQAQAMRLKGQLSGNTRSVEEALADTSLGVDVFPVPFRRNIEAHSLFKELQDMSGNMVMGMIEGCSSCELETDGKVAAGTLCVRVKEPSQFICCIYNLMTRKLARRDLGSMITSRCSYLRCAGFLYVRLVLHPEQLWEVLSPHLMDTEFILPFPEESLDSVPVGKYVEDLLTKENYCDLCLPRMQLGVRKTIERRLLFYDQFRRRYAANHKVLDEYNHSGLSVEVCLVDGHWDKAVTRGPPSRHERCITVPVQLSSGEERDVSIGMVIQPDPNAPEDLTRSRGVSNQDLLERYNKRARDSALAVGNGYCKPLQSAIHIASQRVVAITGSKNKDKEETQDDEDLQEERLREAKRLRGLSRKHDEELAAIEKKYCAGVSALARPTATGQFKDTVDAPERLRLG